MNDLIQNLSGSLFSAANLIIVVVSVCIILFLGFIVYKNNAKSATNKLFAFLSINLGLWLLVIYTSTILNTTEFTVTFWPKLSLFFAAPMTMLFFFFAHTFPKNEFTLGKKWVIAGGFFTFVVMVLNMSPYAFDYIIYNGEFKTVAKAGMVPFSILSTIFSISAIYQLVRKHKTASNSTKKQLQYMSAGLLLMTGLMTITILIPVVFYESNQFVIFAPLYALIFLGLTAYAIIKHKLFDLKILATEIFVVILSVFFFSRLFLVNTFNSFIIELMFFLSTIFFGNLLIRSVANEVKQREQVAKLNNTLKTKNSQLKELLDLKTEFIGIASHQLRTPLTTLIGLLDMQQQGDFKDLTRQRVHELQDNMLNSALKLRTLINDLMDSTKMEGAVKLDLKQVDAYRLIKQVTTELDDNFKAKNLSVSFSSDGGSGVIEADEKYLHEAFTNILDNAEKYTLSGSIKIFAEQIDGEQLQIKVKDTGIGLTKDDIKKLYVKFSRGSRSATINTEGSGLGIYIIKKIIDAHNGTLDYFSEGENKGTTVTVTLPKKQPKQN